MTGIDWAILAFAALMAVWGYRQGLVVGLLSLTGFVAGAALGGRIGPELLPEGSESPYAPAIALSCGLLLGGVAAVALEGFAHTLRARLVSRRGAFALDAAGGAALLAVLGIALAWLFGVVALNAPAAKDLRRSVQESVILRELNETFPPTGSFLNALNRIDPRRSLAGPDAPVEAPDSRIAGDPEVQAAGGSVVRVLGTACGLGVSGSGWVAAPGLVVTAAHVVAGQDDTAVAFEDDDERLDATPVHYDPSNDLAILRVEGLETRALVFDPLAPSGLPGAVLGYPENGPFAVTPARLGETQTVISEDSYGNGPLRRSMVSVRGEVVSGNSGGPVVDGDGEVLATVFASTVDGKRPGGYAVPNSVVSSALAGTNGEVGTGPCT